MRRRKTFMLMLSACAAALSCVQAADAQDVVVMRRVIAPPTRIAPGSDPVNPPKGYYSWKATAWVNPPLACGVEGTATRTVRCARSDDSTANDTFCMGNGAGAKPDATDTVYGSCTPGGDTGGGSGGGGTGGGGTPTPGSTPTPGTTPTPTPGSTPTPTPGSTPAPTPGSTPTPTQTDPNPAPTPILTYGWTVGGFSTPSSTCGSATSTRAVACQRSDGAPAADDRCDSTRPSTTQTTYETSGCGFSWREGDWDNPVASCGATTQTRPVTCMRSDNQPVADAYCSDTVAKPITSRPSTDYGKCTFAWAVGSYSAPNTTCGTVTQTRSVYCQRSDGPAAASAASCTEPKPDTTQTSYDVTGCTFYWDKTQYAPATPACGASTHSRTVSCKRSDGQPADADKCVAADKPTSTEPTTDYGTCSYDWYVSAWGGGAQCGKTVTQTRTVYCERSNKDSVDDSLCSGKGAKPAMSQPITDYSSCTYAATYSTTYGACTQGKQTAPIVSCTRSDNTPATLDKCSSQVSAPISCVDNKVINGTFNPTGGGWVNVAGFTYNTTNPNDTKGQLTSSRSSTPAEVRQSIAVVANHTYAVNYESALNGGSFCASPYTVGFFDAATQLAVDTSDLCGSVKRTFSWKSTITKTISFAVKATPQGSNAISTTIDNITVIDQNP